MKSAVIESVPTPNASVPGVDVACVREDRGTRRPVRWGALYIILLASVGLCWVGIRLVAAVGHAALIEYGAALVILGLLAAWVHANRLALCSPGVRTRSGQPFSVIHVPFSGNSARSARRALGVLSKAEHQIGAGRQAPKTFHS